MKINGANRGSGMTRMLKTVGILGVVGMAGAVVMIAPLAGSGCSDSTGGAGGGAGSTGLGGAGGIAGTGGIAGIGGSGGVAGVDAGADAGTDATVTTAAALQITIQNFVYLPSTLTVPRGSTVTVHNADTAPHSVTSEAAMNNYTPGAVAGVSFDTGVIAPGTTATFTISATAPVGTVIPFFCSVHLSGMPQGMITVQ